MSDLIKEKTEENKIIEDFNKSLQQDEKIIKVIFDREAYYGNYTASHGNPTENYNIFEAVNFYPEKFVSLGKYNPQKGTTDHLYWCITYYRPDIMPEEIGNEFNRNMAINGNKSQYIEIRSKDYLALESVDNSTYNLSIIYKDQKAGVVRHFALEIFLEKDADGGIDTQLKKLKQDSQKKIEDLIRFSKILDSNFLN